MNLVDSIVAPVLLVLGSVLCGLLICVFLWAIGRGLGHPRWGFPLTLVLVPLAVRLPSSMFLDMTVIFTVTFAAGYLLLTQKGKASHAV